MGGIVRRLAERVQGRGQLSPGGEGDSDVVSREHLAFDGFGNPQRRIAEFFKLCRRALWQRNRLGIELSRPDAHTAEIDHN